MEQYGWLQTFWSTLIATFGKELAAVIAGVIVILFGYLWVAIYRAIFWLWAYHHRLQSALTSVARTGSGAQRREGRGLWVAAPITYSATDQYKTNIEASRILVVANAKGGVGKTTVAANLGACLSSQLHKPILLIDLDFQGTLSSMAIGTHSSWLPPPGQDSRSTHLISGDLKPQDIASEGHTAAHQPRLRIITAFYDLAQAENRVMVEWLLGDRKTDIRFRLAELLHDPAVRDSYSLIIIDSPPRLTTGAIQALAAGTHLLIPTILDEPSSEAVVTFVRQVETFRRAKLCPHIKHIGVVGSLALTQDDTGGAEQRLTDRLNDSWNAGGCDRVTTLTPPETRLPRSRFFRRAVGVGGIAYLTMGDSETAKPIKSAIEMLSTYVKSEMKL